MVLVSISRHGKPAARKTNGPIAKIHEVGLVDELQNLCGCIFGFVEKEPYTSLRQHLAIVTDPSR